MPACRFLLDRATGTVLPGEIVRISFSYLAPEELERWAIAWPEMAMILTERCLAMRIPTIPLITRWLSLPFWRWTAMELLRRSCIIAIMEVDKLGPHAYPFIYHNNTLAVQLWPEASYEESKLLEYVTRIVVRLPQLTVVEFIVTCRPDEVAYDAMTCRIVKAMAMVRSIDTTPTLYMMDNGHSHYHHFFDTVRCWYATAIGSQWAGIRVRRR